MTRKRATNRSMTSKTGRGSDNAAFRVRLRGPDSGHLSMAEVQQGLIEAVHMLKPYGDYRAKWVTLYLTIVDEDGHAVLPDQTGEWTLHPYRSAADEHGI